MSTSQNNGAPAKSIKQEMQRIRQSLPLHVREVKHDVHESVQHLRHGVQQATDWKFYVKRYPAFVLPLASLAAYAMVPKRKPQPIVTGTERLASMLPWSHEKRAEEVAKKSWMAGVGSLIGGLAIKSATGYVTRFASEMLRQRLSPQENASDPGYVARHRV